jgi:rfaE bifunctional protein kinase chain/domain
MNQKALDIVNQFTGKRVLVVGDVMLDEYIEGTAERISPEAPIPVLLQKNVRHVLGGAANVAANCASLGARVTLVGHIGEGERAVIVKKLCKDAKIDARFVSEKGRPTITKMRFVSEHFQLVRIDIEDTKPLSERSEQALVTLIKALPKYDVVIISDYAKGLVSQTIVESLKKKFGAGNIIADMKPQHKTMYRGIRAITPNVKEALDMTLIRAQSDAEAELVAKRLAHSLRTAVVLTRGPEGITVRDGRHSAHFKNSTSTVRDVTGAGDTLIAVLALALAAGTSLLEAAQLANTAAGIVVSSAGTIALTKSQFEEHLRTTTL